MGAGDRVVVGGNGYWTDQVTVMGYEPLWNGDGSLVADHWGAASMKRLGGVKGGSRGTVMGDGVKVHRQHLHGEVPSPTAGGVDLVLCVPVQLDYYQAIAWLPITNIKVVGGEAIQG